MKLKVLFSYLICILINCSFLYSQVIVESKAEVRNIEFNISDEKLIITYDLVNTKPKELFTINVNIIASSGKKVSVKHLSGDVNEGVKGGYSKRIIWDIPEDIAFLDENIYVEINGVHQNPRIIKPINKGQGLLMSTFYPGWGSTRLTLKPVHIFKGVLAYGCLAVSINAGIQSTNLLDDYKNSIDMDERDRLYQKVQDQDMLSMAFIYGAGAVWLIDYLTVLITENKSTKKGFRKDVISLTPTYDKYSNSTLLSLKIKF